MVEIGKEETNVEELKTAEPRKLDPQQELSAKIHKIVVEGGYPLPVFIAVAEMLKTEYMLQAYMSHVKKEAGDVQKETHDNLIKMGGKSGGNLTPEMIQKIKKSQK